MTDQPPNVRCYNCNKYVPRTEAVEEPCCGAADCENVEYLCRPCGEVQWDYWDQQDYYESYGDDDE